MSEGLTLVIVAHKDKGMLSRMLQQVREQTRQPDEIIVAMSELNPEELPDNVTWLSLPNRDDWGYHKRAAALAIASHEWVSWWNFDDLYDRTLVETLMKECKDWDVTYWPYRNVQIGGVLGYKFERLNSDAGNFAVRTSIARQVDYKRMWERFKGNADGEFIDEVARKTTKVRAIARVMMTKTA